MKRPLMKTSQLLLSTMLGVTLATTTLAIQPQQWSHTTEADFAGGDPFGTVVTNLGDIRLSSDTTAVEGLPEDVTHIYDMVTLNNGDTYIAAGPDARLLKLSGGNVEVIAKLPGEHIFALHSMGAGLVVGISSADNTRAAALSGGELVTLAQLPEERYIWDIVEGDRGTNHDIDDVYYVATGPNGRIYTVPQNDINADVEMIFECSQSNVLSLAGSGRAPIYAGTDQDGLVYRIEEDGTPFVLYDAHEPEIGSLVVMDDGTVYAGTAAADQAKPGRMAQPVAAEQGRPETPEEPAVPEVEPEAEPAPEEEPEPQPEAEQEADASPTPEDYDRLRTALRTRLDEARESGQLAGGGNAAGGANNAAAGGNQRASRAQAAAPSGGNKQGNAVYQIDPQGFVSEVFRESAMILKIVPDAQGNLIVATGNEGQVFSVNPALRETTVLADLDSEQAMTMALNADTGDILVGGANPASLTVLGSGLAQTGQYTSQVLDAGQTSMFGTFKLTADIPAGCSVRIETRSGNVGDPELAAWSVWTESDTLQHNANIHAMTPREASVASPPARFLQYRLTLVGNGEATATVDRVDLAYVSPNMPPQIAVLTATTPQTGAPGADHDAKIGIAWQATDDNGDRVVYNLEYRPAGAENYLPLASDHTTTSYEWQTQHVPDGWYTLRVTGNDKLDNPGDMAMTGTRQSDAVLVDNTPPSLDDLTAEVDGDSLTLTATAGDDLSAIRSIGYSLDGSEDYAASLPTDLIYDSTSEAWSVTIPDLSPGGHVVALRVIDARGNTAYRQVIIKIE